MFARRILNPTKCAAKSATATSQRRAKSTSAGNVSGFLYNNVWMKSTPLYIGYIFAGAVAVEFVFGFATDAIFNFINRGKLFDQCNMAQFKLEGADEEEEEEAAQEEEEEEE